MKIDLAAAKAREQQATRARSVRFYDDVDGQAVLHARGPLGMIAAIKAALEASLGKRPAGDERCKDEREFDLFVALLTGSESPSGWRAHIVVPYATATGDGEDLADVPGFGPVHPDTARDLLDDAITVTPVYVDEDGNVTHVGDDVTPGAPATAERTQTPTRFEPDFSEPQPDIVEPELHNPDPVETQPAPEPRQAEPTKAEKLAKPEPPTKVATPDAIREAILAMGKVPVSRAMSTPAYRVPKRVQRFLEARDRTCVFPGCHRPAAETDNDHRVPWPLGETSIENLPCLCRHHHRAKQAVFTVEQIDGDYRWTTRGGWRFVRRRQGY